MGSADEAWTEAFDVERVFKALRDLAASARLESGDDEVLASYKWIVDRISADSGLLDFLMYTGDSEDGLYRVLPGARRPLEEYQSGFAGADERRWAEAVEAYRSCQTGLVEAGLTVFACRVNVNLADNYLRLYEIQRTLDHLAMAEEAPAGCTCCR